MESYRVYKSLPLDDFMDNVMFIIGKANLHLVTLVQVTNRLKK